MSSGGGEARSGIEMQRVPHALLLGAQVAFVVRVGRSLYRNVLYDFKAIGFKTDALTSPSKVGDGRHKYSLRL